VSTERPPARLVPARDTSPRCRETGQWTPARAKSVTEEDRQVEGSFRHQNESEAEFYLNNMNLLCLESQPIAESAVSQSEAMMPNKSESEKEFV
jgi:hypothetical protein